MHTLGCKWATRCVKLLGGRKCDIFFEAVVFISYPLPSGTHLRFHSGSNVEWQDVEDLDSAEEDSGDEEQSRSLKVHHRGSLWLHLDCQASEFIVYLLIWCPSLVLCGLCQFSSIGNVLYF